MLAPSSKMLKWILAGLALQSVSVRGQNEVQNEVQNEDYGDASGYYKSSSLSFSEMLVMPLACVRWNNGYMIKYELYENTGQKQCHSNSVGSFLISIAHYMHAHFNYQVLKYGKDFQLPWDAGYLNCVKLPQSMYTEQAIYAKIGCADRGSGISTKLALHLYQDKYCSREYDDGESSTHRNGYKVNGYWLKNDVSFKPDFYTCQECTPPVLHDDDENDDEDGSWYDDDYLNVQGRLMFIVLFF